MRRMAGFKVEGVCFFRVEVGFQRGSFQIQWLEGLGFWVQGLGFRV